mmetsp:Transcript_34243/g.82448  ORF Transcript_34243/g.82448 Transcript_34243/m.82448 type:complete len:489 (-) Transcript_34243:1636-3102(-)
MRPCSSGQSLQVDLTKQQNQKHHGNERRRSSPTTNASRTTWQSEPSSGVSLGKDGQQAHLIPHYDYRRRQQCLGLSNTNYMYFARGPMLVFAAVVACAWPYREDLAFVVTNYIHIWRCLGIATLGIIIFGIDVWNGIIGVSRRGIRQLLECVAVDDILRTIHDPTTGIVATTVGGFVGASAMYTLGMDEGQRIEIVRATLGLNDREDARRILMEKGGYTLLFPDCFQEWLHLEGDGGPRPRQTEVEGDTLLHAETVVKDEESRMMTSPTNPASGGTIESSGSDGDGDSLGCDSSDDMEDVASVQSSSDDVPSQSPTTTGQSDPRTENETRRHSHRRRREKPRQLHHQSDNPVELFFKIVRDMALERIKVPVGNLPVTTIENVGTAALAGLGMQLMLRFLTTNTKKRSGRSRMASIFCAIAMSSVASMSFGSILAREAALGRIYNKATMQLACQQMVSRLWNNIRSNMLTNKTKSTLAFIVLYFVGRKR